MRSFTLKDGNRIREQLLTLSDTELQEHLLHRRSDGAAAALRGHRDAQAGDRRQPHLLALGVDLRHAAGPGARAARDGGAGRLRSRLREPAPPPARGGDRRGAAARGAMPTALPVASRQRRRRAATAAPKCCRPGTARRAAPAPARCASASAPSASTTSTSTCAAAGSRRCCRCPACRAWRPPARCSMSAPASAACCPATASPTSARCPAPTAACAACRPAGCVRLPAAVEDDTAAALLLKGMTADYLLRDLGRVGPGTRLLVHAAAGGVGLLVCAWARRLGATVIGTVSSEDKARVAREHGCEHVIVTRDYRFADAVQRACGGADVIIDGLGDAARDENLAALARARPLDQPGPGQRRAAAARPGRAGRQVDDLLAPGGLRLRRDHARPGRARAPGSGRRWPTARWRRRRSSAMRSTPPPRRTRRLESRRTIGALVLIA